MNDKTRPVFDSLTILSTKEIGTDSIEVCATGQATYEDASQSLSMSIDSFLRKFEMSGKDEIWRTHWLPRPNVVRTHVTAEEAHEAAKEIFKTWGEKVKKSIPSTKEWNAEPLKATSFVSAGS
jgi:hypothetical protein